MAASSRVLLKVRGEYRGEKNQRKSNVKMFSKIQKLYNKKSGK